MRHSKLLQVLLIILLCIIVYGPSLQNAFIWDDDAYVYGNRWVQDTGGLWDIWFTHKLVQYYPLTFTTFWTEHKLWGFRPLGYHVVNVLFHIANALLVFAVIRRLSGRLAFPAALLFAVHPIQVETVAWITERKNLLGLFFFLLAVLAYLRYDRTRKPAHYVQMAVVFVAALLSKSIAVCFVVVPVLYAWWREGTVTPRVVKLTAPLFLIGLLGAFNTVYLEQRAGAYGTPWELAFLERVLLAGRAVFFYLHKVYLPYGHMFFYPRWELEARQWWQWLFPVAAVLVPLVLIYYHRVISRGAGALYLFYLVSIFPALGFINFYPMRYSFVADHFSYLSTPCLLLLLCAAIDFFLGVLRQRFPLLGRTPSRVFLVCLAVLATVYLCGTSMALTRNYKDHETLWTNLIKKNPEAFGAYNILGVIYYNRGEYERSRAAYKKAVEINPDCYEAWNNLAYGYSAIGEYSTAIAMCERALEINPDYAKAHYNMAHAYQESGGYEKAIALYKTTLEIYPAFKEVYNDLANAYQALSRYEEAITCYRKALEIDPSLAEIHYNLGRAYSGSGDDEAASECYRKAIELDPSLQEAYNNLAVLVRKRGEYGLAIALCKKALEIDPEFAEGYTTLGNVYYDREEYQKAKELYRKTLGIKPDYVMAHFNLGQVYRDTGEFKKALDSFEKTLEFDADFVMAHVNLAVVYYYKKQYDDAIAHCDRARELGYDINSEFLNLLEPFRK